MHDDRFEKGLMFLRMVEGSEQPSILTALQDIAPDLARLTVEFGYGDIYARPGLSARHRQLATIGALAALGNARPQLKFHILGALNVGCTTTEIIEALMHIVAYAGFPAGLNGVFVAQEAFQERKIVPSDTSTHAGVSLDANQRYAHGARALAEVDGDAGERVIASLQNVAPDLARLIIEFVFGDLYTRPGLDLVSREIVTVASLTALGNAIPQLKVHMHGLLNVAGSVTQLVETIMHIALYAGFPAVINAMLAAKEVLMEHAEQHAHVA